MKRITFFLALFLLAGLVSSFAQDSYSYDLSKLPFTKNATPLKEMYSDFLIPLPEVDVDLTRYRNVIVRAASFDADGNEIMRGHNKAMVTIYVSPVTVDNYLEYTNDGNRTHIVKAFNVSTKEQMAGADAISSNNGERAMNRGSNPVLINLQSSNADVKYIELREITFRNPRR